MKRPNVPLARPLRKEASAAERTLWRRLRNRLLGGFRFRRQRELGPFILNCHCADAMFTVELAGDVHGTPDRQEREQQRSRYLLPTGSKQLRFWNEEVRTNLTGTLEAILRALPQLPTPPYRIFLPVGERRLENK